MPRNNSKARKAWRKARAEMSRVANAQYWAAYRTGESVIPILDGYNFTRDNMPKPGTESEK